LRRRGFFFTVTLGRRDVTERMPFVREWRKLPVVLSPEEFRPTRRNAIYCGNRCRQQAYRIAHAE
jgi:hypothetical protein